MDNDAISIFWEDDEDKYRLRMVTEGMVEGTLKAVSVLQDNRKVICYDSNGYVSLDRWCRAREIRDEELSWILKSILNTLIKAEKFLLSPGAFPLDPENIYINDLKGEVCLIIRKEDGDWQKELIKTARLILEAVDYTEDRAVKTAYEFFHLCLKEGLRVDELLTKIEEKDYKIIVDEKLDFGSGEDPFDSTGFEKDASWINIKNEPVPDEPSKRDMKKLVKQIVIGVCLAGVCVLLMKTVLA